MTALFLVEAAFVCPVFHIPFFMDRQAEIAVGVSPPFPNTRSLPFPRSVFLALRAVCLVVMEELD